MPLAGLEPALRASEARVTSTYRGGIPPRRSSPGNRTLPPGLEDPGPSHRSSHRSSHRASGGSRTREARFAGACLATRPPMRSEPLPTAITEPPLGVEPSPLAYHASVPCRGHRDGDHRDRRRSWRGPESNRPQPHCKCSSPPWYMPPQKHARSRRGSNSPSAVDSRESSPEDNGTRNNSRVCEGNRTLTARFTDSHADHYTTHTMWIEIDRVP